MKKLVVCALVVVLVSCQTVGPAGFGLVPRLSDDHDVTWTFARKSGGTLGFGIWRGNVDSIYDALGKRAVESGGQVVESGDVMYTSFTVTTAFIEGELWKARFALDAVRQEDGSYQGTYTARGIDPVFWDEDDFILTRD